MVLFTLCPGFGSLQSTVLHQLEGEGHIMDLDEMEKQDSNNKDRSSGFILYEVKLFI